MMRRRSTRNRSRSLLRVAVACIGLLAAACGDDGSSGGDLDVVSSVVSHETTQDILVFAPERSGPWPVVYAMHGIGGNADHMAELGTRLAAEGMVVFAPTFRTDLSTARGTLEAVQDAECGYRFARTIAGEHGGDLDLPVTFVGWSLGASFALQGGLTEEIDPSGEVVSCFTEVPRADVIAAISGCHYEFQGAQFDFDPSGWGNRDADIVVMAGDEDVECAAWQSADAAEALRSAGYDVDLVQLEGADHFAPIFHDLVDGELVVSADEPAGDQTVEVIVTTIADR